MVGIVERWLHFAVPSGVVGVLKRSPPPCRVAKLVWGATMKNYKSIFEGIESTLIRHSSLGTEKVRERLEDYRHLEGKTFSDDEYYWICVYVVFYSGFKAATVTAKLDVIRKYFTDFRTVADYTESDIERIMGDPNMIKNGRKVRACVENARTLRNLVGEHGSFQKYIESFAPTESFENLMLLKEELTFRFDGFGKVAPYHFLRILVCQSSSQIESYAASSKDWG